MEKKEVYKFIGATLTGVLSLSILWEFWLEELVVPESLMVGVSESFVDKLETVLVTLVFSAIALLASASVLFKQIRRRKQLEEERESSRRQQDLVLTQLKEIVEATASSMGQEFFNNMVSHIAKTLDLKFAIIGKLVAGTNDTIESLALYGNGKIMEKTTYSLKGTPCENIMAGKYCAYPEDVQMKFPEDKFLVDLGIQSYLGTPMYSRDSGSPVGLLVVMDDKPMDGASDKEPILRIFSVRAEAELERQEAEKRIQSYSDELERSNEALAQFASIASHDLKEPLRKVVAFASRLEGVTRIGEREKDYIERMQKATNRMGLLIDDLLDYSKVSIKKNPFRKVELTDVVAEVILDIEESLKKSNGIIEVTALPALEADKVQMRHLFQNILSNALKFHQENLPPKIIIRSQKGEAGQWEIFIEDNGIGIGEEFLEKIFQPFERLHGSSLYEGTGMGLAICKKIVEGHQGEISLQSQIGSGTAFMITLPEKQIEI